MIDIKYRLISMLVASSFALAACSPAATPQQPQGPASVASSTPGSSVVTETVAAAAPASEGAFDACALVTVGEAGAALGEPVAAGQRDDNPPLYSCEFDSASYDYVQIVVVIYDDASQAQAAYQMAIDINSYLELSGLGDRAYNAQPIFDVNVLIRNMEVSIDISDSSDDASQLQRSVELAQMVLDRLP